MEVSSQAGTRTQELDLLELLHSIGRRRILVATFVIVGIVLAIAYLHAATYKYTIELQVTAADTSTSANSSGGFGSLRGLASIAGITLPGNQADVAFQLYVESLHSRAVAEEMMDNVQLLAKIFSAEWDPHKEQWRQPPRRFGALKDLIKRLIGIPARPWRAPDAARVQEYMEAVLDIEQNQKTPVVTMRMEHPDPAFGIEFLQALHEAADDRLRRNALDRSSHYIDYLTRKLDTIVVAEHRLAIAQTLSEQEKMRMTTGATTTFAAEPFGPPAASSSPTTPNPIQVLLAGMFGGLFAGVLAAVIGDLRQQRRVPELFAAQLSRSRSNTP